MLRRLTYLTCFITTAFLHAEEPTLPPDAKPMLPETALVPTKPTPEDGRITPIEGGWRLDSPGKLEKSYNLAVSRTFEGEISADTVCLAVIKARTVSTDNPDGKGLITFAVQNTKDYAKTPLWRNWALGKAGSAWETCFFAFQPENPTPAGGGVAKVIVGLAKQVIEVADFQVYVFPKGFDIFNAPRMKVTYDGRELDAPWRKEADERIAKFRRGEVTIKVTDGEGKALEGAKVKVAMKRHLFGFGSAVDVNMLSGLGSKLTPADQTRYLNTVDELFSRVVPEMGLRVGNIDDEPNPEKPWEAASRRRTGTAVQWTLQWAQDRRMTSRGHYLAWGYLEPWAGDEVKKGGPTGLMARYDRHFRHVLPFGAPYVDEWDALNHPVPFKEEEALYNVVGRDVHAELYAKIRPQTDKLLFVNEDTFNPERAAAFEKHVKHMIAKGQTPDGCGFQSHFSDYNLPPITLEWEHYQKFGAMVKHLTVTEYDLQTLDDQLHADHLRDMLTLSFSHPQMTGFVIWGFWEGRHWKPTAAMFKNDWTERPAVKVWRDLVKTKWWTNADLTTNAKGEVSLDGYFGWYDITIDHGGKAKATELQHATKGGKPTFKLE
jgi:endo-1,4-beta-xylanase